MGFLTLIGGAVVLFWIIGFFFKIGGSFIHILLVVAAAIFVFDWIFNRKPRIK
jgi:4-hydroxybenzoate polyprenyltransferase